MAIDMTRTTPAITGRYKRVQMHRPEGETGFLCQHCAGYAKSDLCAALKPFAIEGNPCGQTYVFAQVEDIQKSRFDGDAEHKAVDVYEHPFEVLPDDPNSAPLMADLSSGTKPVEAATTASHAADCLQYTEECRRVLSTVFSDIFREQMGMPPDALGVTVRDNKLSLSGMQFLTDLIIKRRGGYWDEDSIFNRLIEEVGEFARARRKTITMAYATHPDRVLNEQEELTDCVFTLLAYANVKGFNVYARLEERLMAAMQPKT